MRFTPEIIRDRLIGRLEDARAASRLVATAFSSEPQIDQSDAEVSEPASDAALPAEAAPEPAPAEAAGTEAPLAETLRALTHSVARLEQRFGQMLELQRRQNDLHLDLTYQRIKINEVGQAAVNRMSAAELSLATKLEHYAGVLNARIEALQGTVAGEVDAQIGALRAQVGTAESGLIAKLDAHIGDTRIRQEGIDGALEGFQTQVGALTERVSAVERVMCAKLDAVGADMRVRQESLASAVSAVQEKLRAPVIPVGSNLLVVLVDSFVIGIAAADWRIAAYYAFWGALERGLITRFQTVVKPGMVVVDIGANVGIYSLHAARLLDGSGQLHSFEPTPRTFSLLKGNLVANGLLKAETVHLYEFAVTDREGSALLYMNEGDSSWNSIYPDAQSNSVQVKTVALDGVFAAGSRVDVVKMDAEGAEPAVWRGMRRILAENPQIRMFMEFAPMHLRRAGVDPASFLDEIASAGFTIRRVEDYSGELVVFDPEGLTEEGSANLFLEKASVV